MKMVKSLLLGTAAGLVAMTGAQAADLPVKAKPVQYVKICSLYGAGFYYIPGTDMCLKIGGWVRFEAGSGYNGSFSNGPYGGNVQNRTTSDMVWRSRGYITADARNQTEYGTVRSYLAVGVIGNDVGTGDMAFSANRAFIQWAGFTFGHATSFFDFYSAAATQYGTLTSGSDTSDGGWKVMAYTAQFGNGLSATLSAEMTRRTGIYNQNLALAVPTTAAYGYASAYGGFDYPDVVANLRVDQAWGSAQIMGALHGVRANYYGAAEGSGHPSDKMGFAVGAGLKLNAPMIGKGDFLQAQITYAQGASRYANNNNVGSWSPTMYDGNSVGFGVMSDAVYGGTVAGGTATDLQLTTSWTVNAAYEHFWNARWKTSLWGAYGATSYNSSANAMLCNGGAGTGSLAVAAAGCDMNWDYWAIGSRTQWNVTPDFYMGLEVFYANLNSANTPGGLTAAGGGSFKPAGVYTVADQDVWTARFRVHKDFYP